MIARFLTRFITLVLCGSFLFVAACGTINRVRIKKTTRVYRKGGIYHTVQKGQTIYRIAKAYGMDPDVLLRVNRIRNPRNIKAGRKILIPGVKSRISVPARPKRHRGVRSRSLWARRRKSPQKIKIKKGFFRRPIQGPVTSRFGLRKGAPHDGVDIGAREGSVIRAAASGRVIFSDWGPTGYGNIVIIRHTPHLISIYAHNKKNLVSRNEYVKRGEKIALVGRTGRATGPHLHFEIRYNRQPVDPLAYLPDTGRKVAHLVR